MTSPAEAGVAREPRPGLRGVALAGAGWTLVRFAGQSGLRLAGNLVLTRLLFPEAFGLMALVTVSLEALELFSDVGLKQSVISSPRGAETNFLRTVWTMQLVRGGCIFAIALLLAVPVARFYDEPLLAGLVSVAALSAIFRGATSTAVMLLGRQIALRKLAVLELLSQAISLVAMATWAWFWPTVWVLPAGAVLARALLCGWSHLFLPGPSMRLSWDADVRRELIGFGRWILISSILGFLVNSLDRLTLGRAMSMGELGAYSIALALVRVVLQIERRLRDEVLYPVMTRFEGEGRAGFRRALIRARVGILAVTHPTLIGLAILGPALVGLLYDERYAGAGWMLQVLAAGYLIKTTMEPSDCVLLARRDSFSFMKLLAVRSAVLCVSLGIGAVYYGAAGIVVAVAFSEALAYPACALVLRRYDAWLPALDVSAIVVSLACVVLGLLWLPGA